MSESEDGGERTELPTEKRLREAREQGNIPQSRELSNAAVFGAGVFALMALARGIGASATVWMKTALSPDPKMRENPMALFGHFGDLLLQLLWVMLPLIGICLAAGVVGPLLMSGLHFSSKAIMPDLTKLNPMNGIKRMWGSHALAELVKSVLRLLFVGLAASLCISKGLHGLRSLANQPLEQAVGNGLDFTKSLLFYTAGALLLLAA
ncbi:EscU/YscU/HrcU family type III secretion system export apparatus switch protein, partial [Xanthomonas fragariae]